METAHRVRGCLAWPPVRVRAGYERRTAGNKVRTQQQVGCTEVISCSRHWPCLFPQHGPGRKHMRTIELQPWQRTIVTANAGRFARGLFHSDGYRGFNRVRRTSWNVMKPRFQCVQTRMSGFRASAPTRVKCQSSEQLRNRR